VLAGNNVPMLYRPYKTFLAAGAVNYAQSGNLWSMSPLNHCGLAQTSVALVTMLQNSFLGPPTSAASSSYSVLSISEEMYATGSLQSLNLGF